MPSRSFPPPPNPTHNHPNSFLKAKVLFLALTISASLLILIALFFFLFYLYHTLLNRSKKTIPFDSTPPLKLHRFSYKDLKSATHLFSDANSVGKGGSGTVFRGILRDGKSVAVKVLDASSSLQAEREFQNELQILGGLRRSPFVVSLLGYCVEKKRRRFLVYEYMPNRSLQESLFGEGSPAGWVLNWEQRFEIVLDVARALAFLHLECDPPVIHGDIKPSNVLLGSDYRAKISDFGLSRVKVEGEFGVDLFSQELGRSQELWKSQELSGNPVTGVETPAEESSKTEVDFAFALQASSSSTTTTCFSKKNILDNNNNNDNGKSLNLSFNGDGNDFKGGRYKGKEIFGCCDVDGEYWNKLASYDDELYSIDHSRELNVNASSPPTDHDPTASSTKQWGKDWWWRQDGSGELCSKDYVMEWIGSQICPSRNPDWDEDNKTVSPVKLDHHVDSSIQYDDKLETRNEAQFEEHGFESNSKKKMLGKREAKGGKGGKKKHRKMQEWWKEENLAEISKKGGKLRKLEAQLKKKGGFKNLHFDLGRNFRIFDKGNAFTDKNQNGSDQNLEFSFRKGLKKKKKTACSTGSDIWSGDLFSRELSSTTSMRGTVCYVAPEYGGCGYLMEKADIYSLGVLILVIISGRRPLHVLSSPMKLEKANLISWCRQLSQAGNVLELVDERLKNRYNKEQATLCINLALLCLQKMPELRPDIGDIVKILKGEMDLPALPIEFSPSPPSKLLSRSQRKKMKVEVE